MLLSTGFPDLRRSRLFMPRHESSVGDGTNDKSCWCRFNPSHRMRRFQHCCFLILKLSEHWNVQSISKPLRRVSWSQLTGTWENYSKISTIVVRQIVTRCRQLRTVIRYFVNVIAHTGIPNQLNVSVGVFPCFCWPWWTCIPIHNTTGCTIQCVFFLPIFNLSRSCFI